MSPAKKLTSSFLVLLALVSAEAATAKTINMYDQPAANAKSVGSLDSERGIITIFTPKGSDWTKVADPANGNVGWIKTSDLGNSGFHFKVITGERGNHQYQIYQYGNTPGHNPVQIENQIHAMEASQQMMQRDMQRMMNDMFSMFYYPSPVFVPVFINTDAHNVKSLSSTQKQSAKTNQNQ